MIRIVIALGFLAAAILGVMLYHSGIAHCADQQTIEIGHMRVAGCAH